MCEIEIRLTVSEETHKKAKQLQGLFAFKEGKKTVMKDLYPRIIEQGIIELMKQDGRTNFK